VDSGASMNVLENGKIAGSCLDLNPGLSNPFLVTVTPTSFARFHIGGSGNGF
jgi:hypothetical protein